jgi:SAM-dependent methyltransferase
MPPSQADTAAAVDQQAYYDSRFATGRYMADFRDYYEVCRVRAIRPVLAALPQPETTLDYGCGEGRYLPVLREAFPSTRLHGCDVSQVAVDHASRAHPQVSFEVMSSEVAPFADESFAMVLSIEVLEHVGDVRKACKEIGRVLRPGGWAVITTPCANPWSLEWLQNRLRGGFQATPDGYGRFATDEPGHLRRLRSEDLRALLDDGGLDVVDFFFRGHLFTHLANPPKVRRLIPGRLRAPIGMLDWRWFKHRSHGSTMLAVARKRD